jgi:hypothetical protein
MWSGILCYVVLSKSADVSEMLTTSIIRDSPDVGSSKHLWNVIQFIPERTAQYPRRKFLHLHWELEISLHDFL